MADHVLVEPDWVRDCAALFAGRPAWLVGVYCPLEVLEERERERKDRTLGQAQIELVHKHGIYDLEVDTSKLSPQECAQKIKDYIGSQQKPKALRLIKARQQVK